MGSIGNNYSYNLGFNSEIYTCSIGKNSFGKSRCFFRNNFFLVLCDKVFYVFSEKLEKLANYHLSDDLLAQNFRILFDGRLFTCDKNGKVLIEDYEQNRRIEIKQLNYISQNLYNSHTFGNTGDNTICLFDLESDVVKWSNNNGTNIQPATNGNYITSSNMSRKLKTCLDFDTGELLWTRTIDEFKDLKDLRSFGWNILIGDSNVGASRPNDVPSHSTDPYPLHWFAVDILSQKVKWRIQLPKQLCHTIYGDHCYHYIFRDMDKGTYYYSSVDFETGNEKITIDITEEVNRVKPPQSQPFYDDLWWRAMTVSENFIYFGIGVRFVRMNRLTYQIEVLYEGKSVFDNSEFAFGRLFVTEMIGGTVMFSEKGAPETDLDRFFMNEGNI